MNSFSFSETWTEINPNPYYKDESKNGHWSLIPSSKRIAPRGPWCELDYNRFHQWWKNENSSDSPKLEKVYAFMVIEDTTSFRKCWHVSSWYYERGNRHD